MSAWLACILLLVACTAGYISGLTFQGMYKENAMKCNLIYIEECGPDLFIYLMSNMGVLHKPLNLKVESRNFSLFLTWLPNPKNPPNVMYDVSYKVVAFPSWTKVRTCTNVSFLECDLTCTLINQYHLDHIVKVRAVSHLHNRSPWVELGNLSYIVTVDPDPPVLHINYSENNVSINASVQTPSCVPQYLISNLKYSVEIKGHTQKEPTILPMTGSTITIKTHGYKGEYCFAAKTLYEMMTIKESKLSNPVCKNFTQKTEEHQTHLLTGLSVVLISFIVVLIMVYTICYGITKQTKLPKVLNFTCYQTSSEASNVLFLSLENYHQITICDNVDVMSLVLYNENYDNTNNCPSSDRGYTQRPTMQDKSNVSQAHPEYSSSVNSSDKSSSDFNCETTSESSTGISMTLNKMQINDYPKDNKTDSGGNEASPVNKCEHNLFTSLSILDTNSMGNVPFDSLCIGSNNQMETSDDESSNQYLANSEESLEQITTVDWEMSNSYRTPRDGKTQNNWKSGYEQRTVLRGC